MVPLNIKCTHCGADLMTPERPIDLKPSIHLRLDHDGRWGDVWLSALYGSPAIECSIDIPTGAVVDLHCPSCGVRFRSTRQCGVCLAPMVNLGIQEAGEVVVCCRWGCKNHLLEFSDIAGSFAHFFEEYSPFFAQRPSRDPGSEPKDL